MFIDIMYATRPIQNQGPAYQQDIFHLIWSVGPDELLFATALRDHPEADLGQF